MVWAAIVLAAELILIDLVVPNGIGWWWLLVGPFVYVLSIFPGSFALQYIAMSIEWLCISLFACKKCGSRRFSFGKTHGFGL